MRIFTLRYGKNAGEHHIYMSNDEACEFLGIKTDNLETAFPLWSQQDVKQWDWVRTDDGRVVQVLNVFRLPTGKSWLTVMVKVVFGVYKYVIHNSGKIHYPKRMDADPVSLNDVNFNHTNIGGQKTIAGRYLTTRKRLFAYYVVITGNPVTAMVKAGMVRNATYKNAFNLLKDKYVLQEVQTYMPLEDFKTKLKKAFENHDLNAERFASEMDIGLVNAKKGGLAHKQWVEMLGKAVAYSEDAQDQLDGSSSKVSLPAYTPNNELPTPNAEIVDKVDQEWLKGNGAGLNVNSSSQHISQTNETKEVKNETSNN